MFMLLMSAVLFRTLHFSNCDCSIQTKMFRISYFNDLKISENSLWSEVKDSVAHCGSDCVRDDDCVSFFYNTQSEMCTAHGVEFNSTGPSIEDVGSIYYSLSVVKDCADVLHRDPGSPDGVYTINPLDGRGPLSVYCDMTTDGGGWTVFQRRVNGTTDFYRNWTDYKNGFGDLEGNFWLGNDAMHQLTVQQRVELRIDMLDQDNQTGLATYSNFMIEKEADNYRLTVGGYNGDQGDSLANIHNGKLFTTIDRDNDLWENNCAVQYGGGWWYGSCHVSNLNGFYGHTDFGKGLNWATWHGHHYSMKRTEMKLRPV